MNNERKLLTQLTVLSIACLLLISILYSNFRFDNSLFKPVYASNGLSLEDYVDTQSDVDLVPDKGTHSNFENQKATDLINDTLTEADQAPITGNSENFVDNNSSDVDGHTGHGTSSDFTAQQDSNVLYNDTLTEAATSSPSNTTMLNDGFEANNFNNFDGNGATPWDISTNATYGSPWLTHSGTYMAAADATDDGALTSDDLAMSDAAAIYVTFWYMDDDVDTADNWYLNFYDGTSYDFILNLNAVASEDTWYEYSAKITDSQYFKSNFRIQFSAGSPDSGEVCFVDDVLIIKESGANNYELDYEFSWTTADFAQTNEYLCIRTNSFAGTAENLGVDVWNGGWTSISSALTASAWNNISISTYLTGATIYFRFIGKTETSDTAQNTWQIECNLVHTWSVGVNYELELEEQFTDCDYTRTFEELCIYMGTMNGETLSVQWWNSTSNSWLTIIASLSSNQWNNVSVVDYLTSATFTILFVDGTKTNDLSQGTWQKDSCLLHIWTLGYNLNLRVMDLDLTDNIQGAYVYKDSDIKTSDADGWANWTEVSGTVQIKVQYYGFWVNGTFGVGMDSDKTIDVQCELYDVTVLVQEGVQNAYLASANVTVYNSTSVQGNKITSGVTGNNGQVQLLNLPNNTLTFTQYGGASYSLVIGNTTQLVSSENQTFTLTADQNNVGTNNSYSIIAFIGMTIPLKGSFVTKRLKRKMYKKRKRAEINEGSQEEVIF